MQDTVDTYSDLDNQLLNSSLEEIDRIYQVALYHYNRHKGKNVMEKTQQVEFYTNMVTAFTDALDSFEERFRDKKLLDFFHPSADAADKYKEGKNVMEKESVACFKSFIETQLNKEVLVEYEVIQDLFAEAWLYEDDSLEKFKNSVHEAEYLCSTYVDSWSLHLDECREDLRAYSDFLFVLMYSLIDYRGELGDQ